MDLEPIQTGVLPENSAADSSIGRGVGNDPRKFEAVWKAAAFSAVIRRTFPGEELVPLLCFAQQRRQAAGEFYERKVLLDAGIDGHVPGQRSASAAQFR